MIVYYVLVGILWFAGPFSIGRGIQLSVECERIDRTKNFWTWYCATRAWVSALFSGVACLIIGLIAIAPCGLIEFHVASWCFEVGAFAGIIPWLYSELKPSRSDSKAV